MPILSYRGPSAPGGVSNALTQIFTRDANSIEWWYLSVNELHKQSFRSEQTINSISEKLRVNHYQYCNNFLWPLLHDLPQFAHYAEIERQCYRNFNAAIAARLRESQVKGEGWFVNDYQFALMPNLVHGFSESLVFWHVPWPKRVYEEHITVLAELALGLLSARVVGFHTQEYLANFFEFVRANLRQFEVDTENFSIAYKHGRSTVTHKTRFIVAPLGLDSTYWNELARPKGSDSSLNFQTPFVLSVDRCDYTKGIAERLEAIDIFFEHHPQWRKRVFFLQLGTRSRQGLFEFDRYWQRCRQRADTINERWATDEWQPLVWIDNPVYGEDLASLYARAAVMLVSPLRDGLNLTAKEFAACQHARPGVLALSSNAGVWHELKDGCVALEPEDSLAFAHTIANCLQMSETEKYRRSHILRQRLESNTLDGWWNRFKHLYSTCANGEMAEKVCS